MLSQAHHYQGRFMRQASASVILFAFMIVSLALHLLALTIQVTSSHTPATYSGGGSLQLKLLAEKPPATARTDAKTSAPARDRQAQTPTQAKNEPAQITPHQDLPRDIEAASRPSAPETHPRAQPSADATAHKGSPENLHTTPQIYSPASGEPGHDISDKSATENSSPLPIAGIAARAITLDRAQHDRRNIQHEASTAASTLVPAPTSHLNQDIPQANQAMVTPKQITSDSAKKSSPAPRLTQQPPAQGHGALSFNAQRLDEPLILDEQLINEQRIIEQRRLTLRRLNLLLARHIQYPSRARRRGWEGEVLIGFHLSKAGLLENIHLARSSGYSMLDESALNALLKLARNPLSAPDEYRPAMDLEMPVVFRLTDS